ncbi:MAG: hypothetical protein DRI56_07385 [Chloroflexota bacterium]|nr:MAG: hypothetical protein DRI56_07385 [Chloroflexota bacterium]
MKLESLKNKTTMFRIPGKFTLRRFVVICLLAYVLIGCTTLGRSDSTTANVSPTAATSIENSQSRLAQIQARGVLSVGTAITEPFEHHDPDTGELIGFDIDTAEYIADKLGVELEWIEMPFANLIPSLQDRKVDMIIAAIYIKPEREKLVDFSEPYLNTGLVMVAHPELQAQVKTVQDLAALRVGVKIGATGAELAQYLIANGIALESIEYKDTFDSFLDLEVGRVDVVFNDYLNTLAYIKASQSNLEIITNDAGEINFLSQVGLGIAVHQGDRELLDMINTVLSEMRQDGVFDRLHENWLELSTDR